VPPLVPHQRWPTVAVAVCVAHETLPKICVIVALATDGAISAATTTPVRTIVLHNFDISVPLNCSVFVETGVRTRPYPSEYSGVSILNPVDTVKINDDLLIPPGRHTLGPDEVKARQRERLVRAMGQCVSEQGYADTTIADVVRIARTSRTAFYKHFTDKEECFLATYTQMTDVRIDASLDAAARVDGWDEKLDAGIAAYFRWMAEHPEVAITTVVEVHCAGRRALDLRARALSGWTKTVEGVAVLARHAGVDVEIDETAAFAVIVTAEAYVHEYARHGRLAEVVERTERVQALARSLFA
jgi:AcrR family transcriptional regulator